MQIGIEEGHGTLAVGFISTVSPFVLPAVIRRFSREFPEATLEVHEDLTDNLVAKIIATELDVGIILILACKYMMTQQFVNLQMEYLSLVQCPTS